MNVRDFARGVMPSLAPGRIAFGVLGAGVLVYDWAGEFPVYETGGGMRGDPDLSPDGRLLAYVNARDEGIVVSLAAGGAPFIINLGVVRGNHPLRLRNESVVYQRGYEGVYEYRFVDGAEKRLGDYSATGIAYLIPGSYVSNDANLTAYAPMLNGSQAGDLIAGSPAPDGLGVSIGGVYRAFDPGVNWLDCRVVPHALATWSPERGVCRLVTDLVSLDDVAAAFPASIPKPEPEPVPEPEPEPMPDIPDQTGTVAAVRARYGTPLGAQHAQCLLEIARAIGLNAGLLRKPDGSNVTLPDGTKVSQDIICFPDGQIYDCLGDAEGQATPGWSDKGMLDASRYYRVSAEPEPDPDPQPDPLPAGDVVGLLGQIRDELFVLNRHLGART